MQKIARSVARSSLLVQDNRLFEQCITDETKCPTDMEIAIANEHKWNEQTSDRLLTTFAFLPDEESLAYFKEYRFIFELY